MLKKILLSFVFASSVFFLPLTVSAQQSVLPTSAFTTIEECNTFLDYYATADGRKEIRNEIQNGQYSSDVSWMNNVLGCAVKTGRFKLWMAPFLLVYFIKFLSVLGGVLAVAFIVVGGYHFIIGGVFEEKEKGKKTIKNAIIGFILSMLAYTIVNLVQIAVTS